MSGVRLLAAAALARTADSSAGVALVLASLRQSGGPGQGSLVLAVLLVPHLLAGPLVGLVTDRARRPRLVHAGFVAAFGVALGGILALLGRAPQPLVLAVALLAGCCGPMIFGGLSGRLDDVVAAPDRVRVRGLDAATYNVADIFGPVAGAGLVVSVGVPAAAAVIAVSCLCAAGLLLTVRPLPAAPGAPPPAVHGRVSFGEDLRAGFRAIAVSPPLLAVTAATCLATFGNGMLPSIAVLLGVAHGHPAGGGLLVTAVGVGALAGSLAVARWPVRVAAHRVVFGCLAAIGVLLAVVPLVPAWAAVVAVFAVAGLFDGPLFTSVLQVRAEQSPPRVRTQVFTLGAGVKLTAAAAGAAVAAGVVGRPLWVLVLALAGSQLAAAGVGVLLLAVRGRRAAAGPR
ncbi:MFS transporter [Dactylosporangium matsuzakiense]|uniref:Major facilitator superfamily (MFS) profile domain-containing protein n=1 Tax=Dactylosporangium matsuzakiense TaxID=53360 RepID=A0A9W6KUA8_9ACTN|nr:MFS transporter [Dactylosporangium matsuzakiense]UWZ49015.1 MFS transporter [Dactylosporangium matsuzakiense]GLL07413.1 hypothetical protein GCM10017581_091650 [Dactylosporangium matsuzakiense]